ncbi:MAG: modified peptide precursor CbpA [Deltaproteobacteria bacterium]|nr:modified peptide precursor CbpA [Deltaproteobacteria bacterium]
MPVKKSKTTRAVIAYRKTCKVIGTGLSHFLFMKGKSR